MAAPWRSWRDGGNGRNLRLLSAVGVGPTRPNPTRLFIKLKTLHSLRSEHLAVPPTASIPSRTCLRPSRTPPLPAAAATPPPPRRTQPPPRRGPQRTNGADDLRRRAPATRDTPHFSVSRLKKTKKRKEEDAGQLICFFFFFGAFCCFRIYFFYHFDCDFTISANNYMFFQFYI